MVIVKTLRHYGLLLSILMSSSVLTGCATMVESAFESIVETTADFVVEAAVEVVVEPLAEAVIDTAIACLDNDKPVLRGALPNPTLHQEYNGVVQVSLRNEPYDNLYDYTFEVSGQYPPGMRTEYNGRQLILTGTPTTAGEYNFRVAVVVQDGRYGGQNTDGLCSTADIESFHWSIQQT